MAQFKNYMNEANKSFEQIIKHLPKKIKGISRAQANYETNFNFEVFDKDGNRIVFIINARGAISKSFFDEELGERVTVKIGNWDTRNPHGMITLAKKLDASDWMIGEFEEWFIKGRK